MRLITSIRDSLPKLEFSRLKSLRLSFCLLAFLVLGGTSQNIMLPKIGLYLLSVGMIAHLLWNHNFLELFVKSKWLTSIFLGCIFYTILLLVPLPSTFIGLIPGREIVIETYSLMGVSTPWIPISLSPERSILSVLNMLPAFAIFYTVVHVAQWNEIKNASLIILVLSCFTVFFGIAQLAAPNNALHFYAVSNLTSPVGFFSNVNHQATFLLSGLAIVLARLIWPSSYSSNYLGAQLIILITLLIGLIMNSSLAGNALAGVLIFLATSGFTFSRHRGISKKVWGGLILIVIAYIFIYNYVSSTSPLSTVVEKLNGDSDLSRGEIWKATFSAISHYFPFGSGLGSFEEVFRMYEDKTTITHLYVPHAHNDFLQIILELGVIGLLGLAAYGLWFLKRLVNIFEHGLHNKALVFSSVLIILAISLHSFVDYPLRTISIISILSFAMAVVEKSHNDRNDLL